jgi:hypothetical protein
MITAQGHVLAIHGNGRHLGVPQNKVAAPAQVAGGRHVDLAGDGHCRVVGDLGARACKTRGHGGTGFSEIGQERKPAVWRPHASTSSVVTTVS